MGDQQENQPRIRSFLRNHWLGLVELLLVLGLFLLGPWYERWANKPITLDASEGISWIGEAWAWVVKNTLLLAWAVVVIVLSRLWRWRAKNALEMKESEWRTALTTANAKLSRSESENAGITRLLRERESGLGQTIQSLSRDVASEQAKSREDLAAERTAIAVERQRYNAVAAKLDEVCAEMVALRIRLTPPDGIAKALEALDGSRGVYGRCTFSALWVLDFIRESDESDEHKRDDHKWTSVEEVTKGALQWLELPDDPINIKNVMPQIGPRCFHLPAPCVECRHDSRDYAMFRLRPFGRQVLWWAKLLEMQWKPMER